MGMLYSLHRAVESKITIQNFEIDPKTQGLSLPSTEEKHLTYNQKLALI